jgi:hypothetical protein
MLCSPCWLAFVHRRRTIAAPGTPCHTGRDQERQELAQRSLFLRRQPLDGLAQAAWQQRRGRHRRAIEGLGITHPKSVSSAIGADRF